MFDKCHTSCEAVPMSAYGAGSPIYVRVDSTLVSPRVDYGIFIDLDNPEALPEPHPMAMRRIDFAVQLNGRVVELSFEELAHRVGLGQ